MSEDGTFKMSRQYGIEHQDYPEKGTHPAGNWRRPYFLRTDTMELDGKTFYYTIRVSGHLTPSAMAMLGKMRRAWKRRSKHE